MTAALTTPALVFILAFAGLFGLVIGSFLNVVAHRVPAGIPLTRESRCPRCAAPVRPWQNVPVLSWLALRGRCASCRTPISARYPLVEAITGVAFVAVTWLALHAAPASAIAPAPGALVLAAYLWFAAASVVLTLTDLDRQLLPRAIVLPSAVAVLALFTSAWFAGAPVENLLRALAGGAILYVIYALLRIIRPDGMGGGDVRLAGLVGVCLGWIGWGALAVGGFAAFALGGVVGLALVAIKRAGRRTAIPFGPWMLAGAWVGIAAGEPVARAYLDLLAGI
ncbi:prepilin peptidase [Microbacterium sp. LRZ72]|uniref:prepilin peptidase n=1 Tax=Microbacterium sp. LRZ72 TaxID=2942481 RepID=UPI0029B8BFD0|nr:prepilin peptidase [Microbacterium sp. LRZ72]MDX2377135.1 prepilin peptidase [Microbacterium sp. LRZ72]